MNQTKIGRFIAKLRKEKNYTQKNIADKLGISEKTISKWECGNGLPEVVYMEPLCKILGITVNELLVGEHISIIDLLETIDQSRLQLVKQLEFEQMKMRLFKLYNIEIETMEYSDNGAGSLTYFATADEKKYVIKYPSDNDMNHPELEPKLCSQLLQRNIPVCDFIENKQGEMISVDENGRRFSVQFFYEGDTFDYNEAPVELQEKSAKMLAKIHITMENMEPLPVGIGEDFFQYRKPEQMTDSYEHTLEMALSNGDIDIANMIKSNMRIVSEFPEYSFDLSRLSVGNTHGDYMISQLIWDDDRIAGIIDWTTACRHPYIWEIVRSYVFMAPECKNGKIDIEAFLNYIRAYQEIGKLNDYDIEKAGELFYYFLTVCNFYGQYYAAITKNKSIYLKQADMAAGLMRWFSQNIDELTDRLKKMNS